MSTETVTRVLVRVTCTNDKNGNPRRGWLVMSWSLARGGKFEGFVDEGYIGSSAIPAELRSLPDFAPPSLAGKSGFVISPADYRSYCAHEYPWRPNP